ncbi:hypothetical protein J2X69_000150 [Algoriphagus sp. 4150]|uniref:hypothetical protein n=1 Tax=Algoriphagus sp. 4150 TaxID=2817756 RepID=UPI00285DA4C5|nr:hypothetical protein [Algoriphagus sp. 4150]MDR7127822.1 hypothetical protein [Algoriphagus sp. 4150]
MVWVFKTTVEKENQVAGLAPVLDSLVQDHGDWNFDLEDCDHILRVNAPHVAADEIIELIELEGFFCEELED